MMNILIVEDDPDVARVLRELVEVERMFQVVAVADDLASAISAAASHKIDLAMVDIQLANEASGYGVASELRDRGIMCVFVTGAPPPFPISEFAAGCLAKPFTAASVRGALRAGFAAIHGQRTCDGDAACGFELY